MSGRYGEKTRTTEAVSTLGQRPQVATTQQPYEQIFTSPGTWTWPGNVTHVEVLLVGGGGGGGYRGTPVPAATISGAGGGGGVRLIEDVAVSAPVPVTVGSGGAGSTGPTVPAGAGGTSAFGPLEVGGGGGGGSANQTAPQLAGTNAPPIGGGTGGNGAISGGSGGDYGTVGNQLDSGNGAGSESLLLSGPLQLMTGGAGRYGYGAGGISTDPSPNAPADQGVAIYAGQSKLSGGNGTANTGVGGNGVWVTAGGSGGSGGSGIVIVKWWE